jgi:hypothetical protein
VFHWICIRISLLFLNLVVLESMTMLSIWNEYGSLLFKSKFLK